MKSYNEMARDVLRRMDEYETAKRKRQARLAKGAATLCCCALALLLGIGAHQSGLMESEIPATIDDALYPGVPDIIDGRTEPAPTEPAAVQPPRSEDSIVINEMADAPSAGRMNIALMCDDFIAMDKAEMNAYYGTDVFPAVPEGLTEKSGSYGIFRRDGGTGEVYWEQNSIDFSNEDQTRRVCVTVSKGRLPFSCFALPDPATEKSEINGCQVFLGQWEDDCYYAEFLYKNVGFRVTVQGLTQGELTALIQSLTD